MKTLNMVMVIILLFCTLGNIYAADQMTINLNGHAYQVDDIVTKKLNEAYQNAKPDIEDNIINEVNNARRLVKTLVDDQKEAGTYNVTFSADGLASGVYIYRMISGKFISQKKMLLVK